MAGTLERISSRRASALRGDPAPFSMARPPKSGELATPDRNVAWLTLCAESCEAQAAHYDQGGEAFAAEARAARREAGMYRQQAERLRGRVLRLD